jgi:hypothetical protein
MRNPYLDSEDRMTTGDREAAMVPTKLPEERAVQLAVAVARKGESVVLLDDSYHMVKRVFDMAHGSVTSDYFTESELKMVRQTQGQQRIEFDNGGFIIFGVMQIPRGFKPDCVIRVLR